MDIQIADDPSSPFFFEPEQINGPAKYGLLRRLKDKFSGKDDVQGQEQNKKPAAPPKRLAPRGVGVGPPRQQTFRRQNSERREKLEPIKPSDGERRAFSASRKRALSVIRPRAKSSPPLPRHSLPTLDRSHGEDYPFPRDPVPQDQPREPSPSKDLPNDTTLEQAEAEVHTPVEYLNESETEPPVSYDDMIQHELDSKWILNLSMHFRDKSDREKFFVTYAETPTRWRRITVSCDYRNAEPGSLEIDLKELQFQRDKNFQIYESIRDSLPEIQFYDTVTNLKLETSQGRLHVHVTEDMNEIIQYPPVESVQHLLDDWDRSTGLPTLQTYVESEIEFHSHLSGFVYRVNVHGRDYIKKEIPGPDSVDEFLYEINALHALIGAENVVQLHAVILDESRSLVKGLLIGFAEKGALVDLLFDSKPTGGIPWPDRLRWSEQIVKGLSEIHEAGFVQGDFTLSNVVIDDNGDACIIDINRRGCPVGWEPPEIEKKIRSNQRISMYIGVKSDLFQLGMTLWAIAMEEDEPERQPRPLSVDNLPDHVPMWYKNLVRDCLSPMPQRRPAAKELQDIFRVSLHGDEVAYDAYSQGGNGTSVDDRKWNSSFANPPQSSVGDNLFDDKSYVTPSLSSYRFESGSSYVGVSRIPRNQSNIAHHHGAGRGRTRARPGEPDPEDSEVELDGHPYLVSRTSFLPEEIEILEQQLSEDNNGNVHAKTMQIDPSQSVETIEGGRQARRSTLTDSAEGVPQPASSPSMASETTPRHVPTNLPDGSTISPLSTSEASLIGCGTHPNLNNDSSNHDYNDEAFSQNQTIETEAAKEKQTLVSG